MKRPVQAAFPACGLLARGVNLAETPAALAPGRVVEIEPVGRRKLAGSPPAFLAYDAWCRIVSGLQPPAEIHVHGEADPLLHPRLFDMIAFAAERGLEVTLTTRLATLAPSRAEACIGSGVRLVRVLTQGEPSPLAARSVARLEEAKRRLGKALPEVVFVLPGAPAIAPATKIPFGGAPASKEAAW
jgi:hypothetical protein